jgi:hypothetical protein
VLETNESTLNLRERRQGRLLLAVAVAASLLTSAAESRGDACIPAKTGYTIFSLVGDDYKVGRDVMAACARDFGFALDLAADTHVQTCNDRRLLDIAMDRDNANRARDLQDLWDKNVLMLIRPAGVGIQHIIVPYWRSGGRAAPAFAMCPTKDTTAEPAQQYTKRLQVFLASAIALHLAQHPCRAQGTISALFKRAIDGLVEADEQPLRQYLETKQGQLPAELQRQGCSPPDLNVKLLNNGPTKPADDSPGGGRS